MPEAGWYDDPENAGQLRWWDGSRWTDQRQPRRDAEDTPPPPPVPGSAVGPASMPSSPPSSPWDTAARDSGESWGAGAAGATGAGSAGAAGGGGEWVASGATLTGTAPPRTFVEAIKVCLTKYVDGKGRASRSEYWYFALFTFIVDVATGGFAAILWVLPSITVSVRRLHDIGKSAWALLWVLLPVIGWIVLIVYAVRPGDPHTNLYG
jgi:uncharacterized membrane protein YhaH (DUF805 family)